MLITRAGFMSRECEPIKVDNCLTKQCSGSRGGGRRRHGMTSSGVGGGGGGSNTSSSSNSNTLNLEVLTGHPSDGFWIRTSYAAYAS